MKKIIEPKKKLEREKPIKISPGAGSWEDTAGGLATWNELIEEVQVTRLINKNLHDLLYKHKIPGKEVINTVYQARKEYYGWNIKPIVHPVIKKSTVKKARKNTRKF